MLVGAAMLAMLALSFVLITDTRRRISDFHLEKAKTALQLSLAMLSEGHSLVESGHKTPEQAKARAMARLRSFRYGEREGYVAILEDNGYMPMYPVHEHLNQANIWDMQDVVGTYIAREAIKTGLEKGVGVNRYYFENPITGATDIKTSAVGRFEPWGWTLIVGVFDNRINIAVGEMMRKALFYVIGLSALFLTLALAISRSLTRPLSALTASMTSIADGALDTDIPHQRLENECGAMARALAVFRDAGRRILQLQEEKEEAQQALEHERLEMTTRMRSEFGEVLKAAAEGDFSRRVASDLSDPNLCALADMLNAFVETVEAGVSTVGEAMSSMSKGRLPAARPDAFKGAFSEMLEHVAATAETIGRQSRHLEHASLHDALTELPNRRFFERELHQMCSRLQEGRSLALLHIDLDRFKQINDTLGHSAGDEVLVHTAKRLRAVARPQDFVARIGGDEFVVLCPEERAGGDAPDIARGIVEALSQPHQVEAGLARFGASIGVAVARGEADQGDALLTNADLALYRAKGNGRNQVCFFNQQMQCDFVESKRIGDEILDGLERGEFVPFFQPQIDVATHRVMGVEALARWRHPVRGVLTPDKFLGVAQELGVVDQIDAQIFTASNEVVRRVNQNPHTRIEKLSVNVSITRLLDNDVLDAIDRCGALEHRLSFELLESIFFDEQDDQFAYRLDALKERGVEIEIDDFGSGRASIIGLLKVAPDRLKIDRHLVAPLPDSPAHQRLLEAIVEIGRVLGVGVIAEGVETLEHADMLAAMGCETLQGFAFARPLPEADLSAYLARGAAVQPDAPVSDGGQWGAVAARG